uniref:Uncharacterized protein n=1 Tax=Arundo donax TaxID=35708 RepID=A0A0A9H5V5_ARUDO
MRVELQVRRAAWARGGESGSSMASAPAVSSQFTCCCLSL